MEPATPAVADRSVRVSHIGFWSVYLLSILYFFHTLLVAYINSTYMERFLSPAGVGAMFTLGAAFSVVIFLVFTPLLRKFGNNQLTVTIALFEIIALVVLGVTASAPLAIGAFLVFLALNPIIFLNLDIYAESIIGGDESGTGAKRGLTLTLMSAAALLAPLSMSAIMVATGNLSFVYFSAAACFLVFVVFLLTYYHSFTDPFYPKVAYRATIQTVWQTPDLHNVFAAHFLLQLFFTWMVIYVPLYLITELGLGWESVGTILAAAMLAFTVFEFPTGIAADRWWGEKELMAIGFLILAISSSWIGLVPATASVGAWMFVMFVSRIGASFVEVTTESYFFKHTTGESADLINLFRLLRPIANMLGAAIGSVVLILMPFNFTFFVLSILMVPGLVFALRLKDTK